MSKSYQDFISNKAAVASTIGINARKVNKKLYEFQRDIVLWALRQGQSAIFADCGLGKTPMQLAWAEKIPGRVLILAPLAVSHQTVDEGKDKFNIKVKYARRGDESKSKITITNYQMLKNFDANDYKGVVLDESSILKAYTGKFRNQIIETFKDIPYKLACTATPSPNDYMELGNHAEFLGVMSRTEMLATYFVHDGGDTQKWRLKGHAIEKFWKWVCSWAVMLTKPSDLGYDDNGFILPPMHTKSIVCDVDESQHTNGNLFRMPAKSLSERISERRRTTEERVAAAAELANSNDEHWLMWCNMNNESASLVKGIDGAVEIKGSQTDDYKASAMRDFSKGNIRALVTKPSIAGFGMNWQHCRNMAFVGLSDSYEQYYQASRRCWRFGQKREVNNYIITASTEGAVLENIQRKEEDAKRMQYEMLKHMQVYEKENIHNIYYKEDSYVEKSESGDGWECNHGDCVEGVGNLADNSVHYTVFSPPFADLYTYSDSDRDMGNCRSQAEFMKHFKYLINELYRVTMPGRLISFHCMNLPTSKTRDGHIGLRDFRGELIRLFESAGFWYHSEVCIWKDPVTAVTRTKALGLLHKQLVKDSAMSRQGIPDYLVTMRKPGENPERIEGELERFVGDKTMFSRKGKMSIDVWQKYASPVWMDINPSRTLQKTSARAEKDEKHICPLQLDVIERALQLWSNEDDIVLSPFMGIGSEGYVAIQLSRRFVGYELKESYYKQAVKNLKAAEHEIKKERLF
jgi:DNA modification methylase